MDENLAVQIQEVKDRSIRNEGRIKKLEKDQEALNDLALSVKELATDQAHVKGDLAEIKQDVKTLTDKPGKRWDSIVEKLIWAVLAAVVAFVLGRVGL